MIYFDHAATTPICAEAFEAMQPYLREAYGNPSSLHHLGKQAKFAVETAREQVAALINARPAEIVFNSGATEGNNHALKGVAERLAERGRHIITTQIEHDAVLHPCRALEHAGFEVTYVGVDEQGIVRLDELKAALRADTILVSVMHANNEMGTLQPVTQIGALCRERNILFHCDACQTVGHIPVDVKALNVDLLSMSGHKFYGAKGAGALYIRRGVRLDTLVEGGPQQKGRRAGTENVPAIVSMGVAATVAMTAIANGEEAHVARLRERLIEGLETYCAGVFLNGHREQRVPGIANFSFDGVEGEGLILELAARAGVCCSTGSACAAGSLDPSPVLLAIGRPVGLARAGTRFSLGRDNTEGEIDAVIKLLPEIIESLRQLSPETRAATIHQAAAPEAANV
ncbi:MAG: cysteine desulfurase [Abitibacteriaceae bacterium]|nr:cysteine desulfurase [Abditibacteriaceae bacterium]MBV9867144.1 cysteine desulfurase [Abditibacteriaceae bacterium]